ncbi:MAG: hypothetical protein E7039_01730 [Lentisphaerae bacterium]|nr:hypothetical protein [Lentisphaerota bacterium]
MKRILLTYQKKIHYEPIRRIPVCVYNVPEEDIYRPACWNAFGMDKEGQDYRACQTYGPMYKTNC